MLAFLRGTDRGEWCDEEAGGPASLGFYVRGASSLGRSARGHRYFDKSRLGKP